MKDPDHYTRFAIQPITFILANRLGFAEGSVIKYVCRYPFKGGIEDLKKAKRCRLALLLNDEIHKTFCTELKSLDYTIPTVIMEDFAGA